MQSVTFTKPSASDAQKYGYTWDIDAAYGSNTTPIYSSFPPFQWADQKIFSQAYQELGLSVPRECAGGDKHGVCWVPTSEHPVTMTRSHSGLAHYALVQGTRNNYDLLVKHQVVRVVYPPATNTKPSDKNNKGSKKPQHQPPLVEVRDLSPSSSVPLFNVTAKAEVIISAGAFNTPAILQRSGIGPPAFLQSAGIPLVIDSPGVGANLQDHMGPPVIWNLTVPFESSIHPLPNDLLQNATLHSQAISQFHETPAKGPYTLAMANSALYLSLPRAAPSNYRSILSKVRSLASNPALLSSYLPPGPDYASNTAMIKGYKSQLLALSNLLEDPLAPSNESPFATMDHPGHGPISWAILLHPFSRGTVHINLTNPLDQPILNYNAGGNPLDFDLHLAHLRFLRRLGLTPTFRKYGAVEVGPGREAQSDEELVEYIKASSILSFQHPCCTAAMLPREKGGVVGKDLKVHGTSELGGGLRVVDLSVTPLLVGSHTSSTAYALGEKVCFFVFLFSPLTSCFYFVL